MNPGTHNADIVLTQYPQWDSNPHWIDFKSIASADWAMGAQTQCYANPKAAMTLGH